MRQRQDDDHDKLNRLEARFNDLMDTLDRVLNKFDSRLSALQWLMLTTAISTVLICVTIILRT